MLEEMMELKHQTHAAAQLPQRIAVNCPSAFEHQSVDGNGAFVEALECGTLDTLHSGGLISVTRSFVSGTTADTCPQCGAPVYCFDR